jgi:hypothetical protein
MLLCKCPHCILCFFWRCRALDVVSKPPEAGKPTTDFAKLFSDMSANCDYSDMETAKVAAQA